MSDLFESKPRWPGAPPICTKWNVLAFKTPAEMKKFNDTNCPSCTILETWLCKTCGHWHQIGMAPPPSGSTSGTTRNSKVAANYVKKHS